MSKAFRIAWVLALAAAAAAPAFAREPEARAERNESPGFVRLAERGAVPLEQVLAGIRAQYPGRHISVSGPSRGGDGGLYYGIKWLTPEGHVLFITVDAETGTILSVQGGE